MTWKTPHNQKHYGVYYATSGITPELNAHSNEWTYEPLVDIKMRIGERVEKLTYTVLKDTEDLDPIESRAVQTWDIKAKRALTVRKRCPGGRE